MKANKYRIKPTVAQQERLAVQFGHARFIYNYCLDIKNTAYKEYGVNISRYALSGMLPAMKRERLYAWLKDAHSHVLQSALLHLDTAFKNFFAKRAKFPRFKKKSGKQSCQYPQGVKIKDTLIFIPKVGWVKAVIHREPIGKIKTVTVSKDATGCYFASVLLDDGVVQPEKVKQIEHHVGLDMGITHFITLSTGEKVDNPRFVNQQQRNLKRKQKNLSRKKKGSQRYAKAKLRVAQSHKQVKNARNDFQHKLSFKLANENQAVSIEELNISGMSKNHRLARHILDVGWYDFTTKLNYKLADRGHHLVKNDRFFASSKTCHCCGHKVDKLPLNIRKWDCTVCGTTHDRDENAAINLDKEGIIKLKAEGYTVSARGGFNVSRVMMNLQTPTKREAPFIALA